MSKVIIAQGNDASAVRSALEDCGLAFVDMVKNTKSICIVSTGTREATRSVIDAIMFHSRTPIHVLSPDDEQRSVEASIPRVDDVRMPVRRPQCIVDAEVVIMLATMFADPNRRTMLSIEQYLFQTWYVPERQTSQGLVRTHAPWLEGALRDVVLADLYLQRPITFSVVDGSSTAGIVLAGFDPIAVDAVGIHMNGIDPEDVGYMQDLSDRGVGVCALSKIDVPLGFISR